VNSAAASRLEERAAFLERELGPCLLVLKCRELLGMSVNELRPLARLVVRGEVERLADARRRKVGVHGLCEHHVRAIYASDVAGYAPDRRVLLSSLLDTVKRHFEPGKLPDQLGLLMACAAIFAEDLTRALSLIPSGTAAASMLTALSSGDTVQLAAVVESLQQSILVAEDEAQLVPWDDVWVYVLLRRLREKSTIVPERS